MNMNDNCYVELKGHIRIYQKDDPSNVLYDNPNVICLTVKSLFARLMANNGEPANGVWGLAIGAGDGGWPSDNQPDADPTQTAIITPLLRKQLNNYRFVDQNLDPVANGDFSEKIDFQTLLNATTDGINTPIREMGLIGGGSTSLSTDMLTAPFWDPEIRDPDSVVLINYKTLPPLNLPPGITFIVSWILTF